MTEQVPAYRVTGVADDNTYDPTKGLQRTKRVTVQFADGHSTYVELPVSAYNAETVAQLLEQAHEAHSAVMGLQGPPVTPPARRSRG